MCHVYSVLCYFFFFKQKTAYEMRISDWSSDVCSSDLTFQQGYGLTESGAMGTSLKPEEHKQPELLSTVGRPNPGIGIKIVDAEGNAVGTGVPGEVLIDSPALMKGYWRKPEETARTLRDGWLHTGEGGYDRKSTRLN